MKNNNAPKFALYLILILLFSCNNKTRISEPTMVEIERIHPVGEKAATDLMQTLQKELQTALAGGNFKNAIEVCKKKAIPITLTVAERQYSVSELKRVTSKYRNPLNAPDSIEQLALEYFDELFAEQGKRPESYIQKVHQKDEVFYNYYKPLYTNGLCLSCHGHTSQMDTVVVQLIDSLYPGDLAKGYNAGDFRGLMKVRIKE